MNEEQACIQKLSTALRNLTERVEVLENKKKRTRPVPKPDWKPREFDIFWMAYPKKVGKAEAVKAWNKLRLGNDILLHIHGHINLAYVISHVEKQYIPNPATYLNQARWNDEIIDIKAKLLKLPKIDELLWQFATDNKLQDPGSHDDYFVYRRKLLAEIEEKGLKA